MTNSYWEKLLTLHVLSVWLQVTYVLSCFRDCSQPYGKESALDLKADLEWITLIK